MPNCITCCLVIICVFCVLLVSVKIFYRFVKIPDQVGDDVRGEVPDQVGDDVCQVVIAGLTGNLFILQRLHRIAHRDAQAVHDNAA